MKSKNINYLDTYRDTYTIPLDNDTFSLCILKTPGMEAFEQFHKIILNEGSYLNYGIFVRDYNEMAIEKVKFYDYIRKNSLYPVGKLIIIENIKCSDFDLNKIYLNLQIMVKNNL